MGGDTSPLNFYPLLPYSAVLSPEGGKGNYSSLLSFPSLFLPPVNERGRGPFLLPPVRMEGEERKGDFSNSGVGGGRGEREAFYSPLLRRSV